MALLHIIFNTDTNSPITENLGYTLDTKYINSFLKRFLGYTNRAFNCCLY